ncbi:protein kinase domain-containing protein [Pseudarthrobacter sp. 1C304]|uniref:protein kinase domain-containing protein n=1 Tax=Pseudarthrobacter sp. 1C304 TaxID=3457438 RepID=UPI003FD18076
MEDYAGSSGAAPEVTGFDVVRCLGRGGTASVWLVSEHSSGNEYALKCFTGGDGAAGADAEEAVRREVRILSVLDHDHLVRARSVVRLRGKPGTRSGSGESDGVDTSGANDGGGEGLDPTLGLIMDYAAGGSLGQLVAGRGKLGPGETVTVLTPVAQALAYLHGNGCTHGDVSPGNVLFTAHGKPLLADLGVARMAADAPASPDAGTDGFRDPAPIDAVRAGLQPERDVYSLAALGWYCLTGSPPEPGAQRPPLPLLVPEVPPALAAALESGLAEDRRLRPTAAEFAGAVHRSAVAAPVDLSVSVHPSVIPQLLTRRSLPGTARERRAEKLRSLLRSLPRALRRLRGVPGGRPAAEREDGRTLNAAGLNANVLDPAGRNAAVLGAAGHGTTARSTAGRHAGRRGAAGSGPDGAPTSGRRRAVRPSAAGPEPDARSGAPLAAAGPQPAVRRTAVVPPAARRQPAARRGVRAAAGGLVLLGVLVAAWGFAGAPLPPAFPGFAAQDAGAVQESGPEQATAADPAPGFEEEADQPANADVGQAPGETQADPAVGAVVPPALQEQLASPDPAEAVRGLAGLRSLALSTGDFGLLDHVNVPASPAAVADRQIAAGLEESGRVLAGFAIHVARAERTDDGGGPLAVVAVTAGTTAYRESDSRGAVLAEAAEAPEQQLRLVLAPVEGRWRIQDILPAGTG